MILTLQPMVEARNPFYLRFGLTVLTMAILAVGLHFGRSIILPFLFSILLSTLLLPVVKFLQAKGLGKILAISLTIIVTLFVLGSIVYFLSTQIATFLEDLPALEKRSKQLMWQAQKWVWENLNIGYKAQDQYIEETTEQIKGPAVVNRTVLSITGLISYLVFLPTYAFLILYHKDMIKKFLITIFKDGSEDQVRDFLQESQLISQQYITGLLIELCIVFVLNAVGFLVIGIKYPIFLALVGAILNIVPYIGMIIANIICLVITLMSASNPTHALWAAMVLAGVQLIDNNVLMPLIVGNRVKLNALAIILGVLVAGGLCGIPGMFLAIPSLALLKVIFERVDHLKPWAMLLGDETTIEEEQKNPVKRVLTRVRSRGRDKKRAPSPRT
jgi:predicted PurR-regulated permease PerM